MSEPFSKQSKATPRWCSAFATVTPDEPAPITQISGIECVSGPFSSVKSRVSRSSTPVSGSDTLLSAVCEIVLMLPLRVALERGGGEHEGSDACHGDRRGA